MNPDMDGSDTSGSAVAPKKTGGEWVSFEDEDVNSKSKEAGPSLASEQAAIPDASPPKDGPPLQDRKSDLESSQIPPKRSRKTENVDVKKDKMTPADGGTPAIISAETVHVNLDRSLNRIAAAGVESPSAGVTSSRLPPLQTLSTVDLSSSNGASGRESTAVSGSSVPGSGVTSLGIAGSTIREGFVNGDIIVTLLPVNTKWPWITPAQFRPELVPEELMAQGLTLTVEDYVSAMETLTNDVRFHAYNACYKRVLVAWICFAFAVLLALLFSGITGLTLFGLGILWLLLNAAAIFLCMWLKIKLNHNLERCLAQVNKQLLRHKILLGLDDRGKLSCHKVNLCFIYFDTAECIRKLQEVIASEEGDGGESGSRAQQEETAEQQRHQQQRDFQTRMDIEDHDIIIQGSRTTRISRKQERGERLLLRYSQRWAKDFLRRRLDWTLDAGELVGGGGGGVGTDWLGPGAGGNVAAQVLSKMVQGFPPQPAGSWHKVQAAS
ncbi:uncharacterized protein LOC124169817 isoform X2 [Ischnura elegans]|uniref:uncharacterized protein LOC124169817 isoform X2 n=1 Tax=Ischnura elegans TaxID=197161 RepID=UPI001ED8B739|nr:uncharacterized protein LOC124169817 isoform X2 [Ischnura elegans]